MKLEKQYSVKHYEEVDYGEVTGTFFDCPACNNKTRATRMLEWIDIGDTFFCENCWTRFKLHSFSERIVISVKTSSAKMRNKVSKFKNIYEEYHNAVAKLAAEKHRGIDCLVVQDNITAIEDEYMRYSYRCVKCAEFGGLADMELRDRGPRKVLLRER